MKKTIKQRVETVLNGYYAELLKRTEAAEIIERIFNSSEYFHVDSFAKGVSVGLLSAAIYIYFFK